MRPTFADPKTDFVFKRIFGAEAHKPLLLALLNDLLELDEAHRILDVQYLSLEQHVAVPELKLSIVDVKCTDAAGRRYVVEMQVLNVEAFEKRVVYNASKAYVMQLRQAEAYPTLCDVVGVTICDFMLWPEKEPDGQYNIPMLSRWRMVEQHSGVPGLPQVQYVFLELPKYARAADPQTMVEKWAYFFREALQLDAVPPPLAERPFRDALDVARTAAFTPLEWEAYERAKMAEQDARGALSLSRREGRAEGLAEGLRQAIRGACTLLNIELSAERDAALRAMDAEALAALHEQLMRERRWP
jgi:predicted transposase/invertase (TIGR01784 family)